MRGHECYHCKQWVEEGETHDCWTTTEGALTRDLPEDLRDAWERLREAASELGEQRIYASHKSIMFARKTCYFFVRPKRSFLEVCVFLGRPLHHPRIRRVEPSSKTKFAHMIQVTHRDEVEAPLTEWLREAYGLQDAPPLPVAGTRAPKKQPAKKTAKGKPRPAKAKAVKRAKKTVTKKKTARR